MAAIARIDYGLAEGEFWRLTPRQFALYGKRYQEVQRRTFRFLATVIAQSVGSDVDFTKDDARGGMTLEAYLQSKAEANGECATNPNLIEGTQGTPETDAGRAVGA